MIDDNELYCHLLIVEDEDVIYVKNERFAHFLDVNPYIGLTYKQIKEYIIDYCNGNNLWITHDACHKKKNDIDIHDKFFLDTKMRLYLSVDIPHKASIEYYDFLRMITTKVPFYNLQ